MTPQPTAEVSPVDALVAEAYSAAALAGMNMRSASAAIERLRDCMRAPVDPCLALERSAAIINEAGTQDGLQPVLGKLRNSLIERTVAAELQRLQARMRSEPDAGTADWLNVTASALARFQLDLAYRFGQAAVGIATGAEPLASQIANWTALVRLERWRECAELFTTVGNDSRVAAGLRARLLTIRAELDLVVFLEIASAESMLARAREIAPEDWRVLWMQGRLQASKDDYEHEKSAVQQFARAAAADPEVATPLVSIGQALQKQGDVAGAETHFLQAARCAIGPSDGYLALIELCGHPTLFAERRDRLASLVERVRSLALNDADGYQAMIAAARACQSNAAADEAMAWYARAIAYSPARHQAHLEQGYFHLQQRRFDAAQAAFQRVLEIAPNAVDGYWGLANVAQDKSDCKDDLRWSLESLQRAPDWRDAIVSRLESLAVKLYQDQNDYPDAELVYHDLRDFLGEDYEATYRNLLGNLYYYRQGYVEAAAEYRLARRAAPQNARYAANLALALEAEGARNPASDAILAEAYESAERARELQPHNAEYNETHERLEQARRFVVHYGTAARALVPDPTRLRILLHPTLVALATQDGHLAPELSERMERLRRKTVDAAKFTLPGVNFREWDDEGVLPDSCAVEVAGARVLQHVFEGSTSFETLMTWLEDAIRAHLPKLLGHEEAQEISKSCSDGVALASEPALLNELTRRARILLAPDGRLDVDALCADMQALAQQPRPVPPAPAADRPTAPPSPYVGLPSETKHDYSALEAALPAVQADVYERTGVVMPLIRLERTPDLARAEGIVGIDQKVLSGVAKPEREDTAAFCSDVTDVLVPHAGALLHPDMLTYHLRHLRRSVPALIEVVHGLVGEDRLLQALRNRLQQGQSIRNLLAILEEIVLSPAEQHRLDPLAP
jgi:tetratricopeptide (TPR) repeat protein